MPPVVVPVLDNVSRVVAHSANSHIKHLFLLQTMFTCNTQTTLMKMSLERFIKRDFINQSYCGIQKGIKSMVQMHWFPPKFIYRLVNSSDFWNVKTNKKINQSNREPWIYLNRGKFPSQTVTLKKKLIKKRSKGHRLHVLFCLMKFKMSIKRINSKYVGQM